MVDASSAPRRVSMAYILGFSNRPFKGDERTGSAPSPQPHHPSTFKQMVTTPGGVIEWAASDGRRGKLTGPGKPRLTATDLRKAAEGNVLVQRGTGDGGIGMFGIFDNAPAAPGSAKAAQSNHVPDSGWTKEQDDKLLELRGENPNAPWADTARELDKKQHECRDRFKQIRPADWKPNNAKGNKQKQGKQKGQTSQNNQKDGEKYKTANGGFDAPAGNPWPGGGDGGCGNADNGTTRDNSGGWNSGDACGAGNTWGDNNGGNGISDDKNENNNTGGQWGARNWSASADNKDENNAVEGFNDTAWGIAGGDPGDNNGIGVWNAKTGGGGGGREVSNETGGDATQIWNKTSWDDKSNKNTDNNSPKKGSSKKPSSNRSSNKAPSRLKHHSRAKSDKPSNAAPTEYELKPDSTFSADDLRLMAKIIQQDCQMVWDRVSWRFRDKTGRNLHPDVFEKKVTGNIGERGSERGGR